MRRVVLSALTLCALVGGGAAFAGTQVFSDVPPDRYFSEPVTWAYENEITFGVGDGRFAPDGAVTRGQNVTFAWRYDQNVVQPALDELRSEFSQAPSVVLRDGDNTYPAISLPARFNNPYSNAGSETEEHWIVQVDDRWWDVAVENSSGYVETVTVSFGSTVFFDEAECNGNAYITDNWHSQGIANVVIRDDGTAQLYEVTGPGRTVNSMSLEMNPAHGSGETPGCDNDNLWPQPYAVEGWPIEFGAIVQVPIFSSDAYWDIDG